MPPTADEMTELLDATAPGLERADVAILFGTTLPEPVEPAAQVLRAGLAPLVVLTGGPNRRNPTHVESEEHARLLRAAGVPDEAMLIERRSTTTAENVEYARPLIEERLGQVRSAIAIVKWWHKRALHTLAAGMPSVERIFAVVWNPPARANGQLVTRDNWTRTDPETIEAEYGRLKPLLNQGVVPQLTRDGNGWVRAAG